MNREFLETPALAVVLERVNRTRLLQVTSVVLGLVAWEVISDIYGSVILAPPTRVFTTLIELIISFDLVDAAIGSFQILLFGYGLAVLIAVPLGFILAQSRTILYAINPYIDGIYSVPAIAYLPLIVTWFGLGWEARVFYVVWFCYFDILINTYEGVMSVHSEHNMTSRSFAASTWQHQRKVLLPASLPFIFTGLRLGVGRAVKGIIAAEIFLRAVNLGRLLLRSEAELDTAIAMAVIIFVAFLGLIMQKTVVGIERKTIPWHAQGEST